MTTHANADEPHSATAPPAAEPPRLPRVESPQLTPQPLDRLSPQLTLRAVMTGMVLAIALAGCNIYVGLKVGLAFDMSIAAALVAYGGWGMLALAPRVRRLGLLENNISQTAASAGGSVAAAGLIAPIPALTLLTGQALSWSQLAAWVFSVCAVGIVVAMGLRRQMIVTDGLPFPAGIAVAETLRELYAKGREALLHVVSLASAAVIAAAAVLLNQAGYLTRFTPTLGVQGFTARSLTFGLEPTFVMYGIGGLVGFRTCLSLLIGAILAWGLLAPWAIHRGLLRLEVSEPLATLPAAVELPPEPAGYCSFDVRRRLLIFKGQMSAAEREALLSQSADPSFQEAVHKLFVRTQIDHAPATSEIETTRFWQVSEPLDQLPPGFEIPHPVSGHIAYDKIRHRLVALQPLSDALVAELTHEARALARRAPEARPSCEAFVTALARLHARAAQPRPPRELELPSELAARVTFDAERHTLRVRGTLTAADVHRLRALVPATDPGYDDFQATVAALAAGARLARAEPDYRSVLAWLLWPGVTLMVVASLVSFAFSWRAVAAAFVSGHRGGRNAAPADTAEVSRPTFISALLIALVASVTLQIWLFSIAWWVAVLGVLLSFALALVAGRVSGETGITPVGAMGKVTQLVFGAISPGQPAANLMTAGVAGGAASQCAALLDDLKCGHLLGAAPRSQVVAQFCGAAAGSLGGALIYLMLIPDPRAQLLTDDWAAPAVAAWKAVAELFQVGLAALPRGAPVATLVAGFVAVGLAVAERTVPKHFRAYLPSPASLGLAFVIPAYTSTTMFAGALGALLLSKCFPQWSSRFVVTICAGLIAGESITGVVSGIVKALLM